MKKECHKKLPHAAFDKKYFEFGSVTVAVIGQGYVGLPLSLHFAETGVTAIGVDIDEKKVQKLNLGSSFIEYISSVRIRSVLKKGTYRATSDFRCLRRADAIIICVPTPIDRYLQPDISFIQKTAMEVARWLRPGQLIVLESTTYPRCTREVVLTILEKSGLKLDRDFCLAFSPEREDPGNTQYNTATIPKLVGGVSRLSGGLATALYRRVIRSVVTVSSAEVAESAKLLENIFRCINIAMVNELKMVFDRMGIDIWEVVRAASTKPFGFMPFYPGPGLGGHCIPIDPYYLTWKAREYGISTHFIELAGDINRQMPEYVVGKAVDALNTRGISIRKSRILLMGFSYKKNVGDDRESPAYEIYELLVKRGATVNYHDPYLKSIIPNRHHEIRLHSVPLNQKTLILHDAIIIVTDHDGIDYNLVRRYGKVIVDTRNIIKKAKKGIIKA